MQHCNTFPVDIVSIHPIQREGSDKPDISPQESCLVNQFTESAYRTLGDSGSCITKKSYPCLVDDSRNLHYDSLLHHLQQRHHMPVSQKFVFLLTLSSHKALQSAVNFFLVSWASLITLLPSGGIFLFEKKKKDYIECRINTSFWFFFPQRVYIFKKFQSRPGRVV